MPNHTTPDLAAPRSSKLSKEPERARKSQREPDSERVRKQRARESASQNQAARASQGRVTLQTLIVLINDLTTLPVIGRFRGREKGIQQVFAEDLKTTYRRLAEDLRRTLR